MDMEMTGWHHCFLVAGATNKDNDDRGLEKYEEGTGECGAGVKTMGRWGRAFWAGQGMCKGSGEGHG